MGRTKRSNPMDPHAQRAKGFQGRCKGQRIVQSLSKSTLNPKLPSLPSLPKYINTTNYMKDEEAPALEDAEVLDEVEENKKRHLNVVFIGHVGRCMAYLMDSNEEEKIKGITVEVRRARFETENTRFAILDAPVSNYFEAKTP
ncbi:hypothetical protein SLEP1_g53143 [Rubroshorea leprosula]|uniref:Uncharacterized protein n=1 Tax=Rubroshorea leprosula TaxID=152421 RepID=A0AAV5MBA4_9ROSI|nr:hypothetical protein SLEP1_g53143 [Rubroshorea leprosula]